MQTLIIEDLWTLQSRCAKKDRSAITRATYALPEPYPVFHVTAITHRKDAIYPATIVGIPPMEVFLYGRRLHEAVLAGLQNEFSLKSWTLPCRREGVSS